MGAVRIFTPDNRLADIVGGPGDFTVDELEARAIERISTIRPDLKAFVAEQVLAIEAISSKPEEIIFAESLALAAHAMAICEVAGAVGLGPLGESARGVSTMIDALIDQGVWHTEALKLHIDALAMLASKPGMPDAEARKVLARLKAMRDGIGVAE